MADKDLGITVTGDISDIEAQLNNLTSLIEGIPDRVVNITAEIDSSQIEQATTELNELSAAGTSAATDISSSMADASDSMADFGSAADSAINSIDPSAINEAASAATALGGDLGGVANEASNAGGAMQGMNTDLSTMVTSVAGLSNSFTGMGGGINSSVQAVSSFTESIGIAASNVELLAIALAAVVAVGIAAYLADAVEKAGAFNDSWSRLAVAVGEGGKAIGEVKDDWSDAINTMKDETGRSAVIIREHIIQMGIAGVNSKDAIVDAFSGISGAAFVTGQSIDSVEQAYKRVVSTGVIGTRQLLAFGLTTDDVYRATGMTLDQVREKFKTMDADGRAAMMNQILNAKYGTEANEAYKNSWQHVGDALQAAWNALSIFVGQLVIPIVRPAIEGLTWVITKLTDGLNFLRNSVLGLNLDMGGMGGIIAQVINAFVQLSLIMNPMGWVIKFISENMGRLRDDFNKFWAAIASGDWGAALQLLADELKWALVDAPIAYIASLPAKIGEFAGQWLDVGKKILEWIWKGLQSLEKWLISRYIALFKNTTEQGASGVLTGWDKWWQDNGPKMVEILKIELTKILPALIRIVIELTGLVLAELWKMYWDLVYNDLLPGALEWGKQFIINFIKGIVGSIPLLGEALKIIADYLPHSPPKTGPLSEVTEEGMSDWMGGIVNAGNKAIKGLDLNTIQSMANKFGITTSDSIESAMKKVGVSANSTISDVAKKIGVSLNTVQGYMNEFGVKASDTLQNVADKFGVTMDQTISSIISKFGGAMGSIDGLTGGNFSLSQSSTSTLNKGVNNNVQQTYNINVDTAGLGGSAMTSSEAHNTGQQIAAGIKNTLEKGTTNAGMGIWNSIR